MGLGQHFKVNQSHAQQYGGQGQNHWSGDWQEAGHHHLQEDLDLFQDQYLKL